MRVLVVDGANVVGSVPDGWWRDRATAAARLHHHLTSAELPYERVVLVLEGQARRRIPEGTTAVGELSAVETVHAPREGDDEIVARCVSAVEGGQEVTVATADRGLLARLDGLGVEVVGPRSVRH